MEFQEQAKTYFFGQFCYSTTIVLIWFYNPAQTIYQSLQLRKVISDRAVAVTYEFTDFGKTALSILDYLRIWSESHQI